MLDNLEALYKAPKTKIAHRIIKFIINNTWSKVSTICPMKKMKWRTWIFLMRWNTLHRTLSKHKIVQWDRIMHKKLFNLNRAQMITEDKMIRVIRHHPAMNIVAPENWRMQTTPYQQWRPILTSYSSLSMTSKKIQRIKIDIHMHNKMWNRTIMVMIQMRWVNNKFNRISVNPINDSWIIQTIKSFVAKICFQFLNIQLKIPRWAALECHQIGITKVY